MIDLIGEEVKILLDVHYFRSSLKHTKHMELFVAPVLEQLLYLPLI